MITQERPLQNNKNNKPCRLRRGASAVKALIAAAALLALALILGGLYWQTWQTAAPDSVVGLSLQTGPVAALPDERPTVDPGVFRTVGISGQASPAPAPKGEALASDPGLAAVGSSYGEHPLFSALRASAGQTIPAEIIALAREITADATNDLGRARAIYDWLTATIRYDVEEWAHIVGGGESYSHDHDPLSVVRRGTTVCIGYAWLFDALAQSVGMNATFLIGDVRGYRGTADDAIISAFKHAWNAVQIDGEWALLDATWGARQTGESADAYALRSAYYFATPANQLIFDHLPESADWQLLADPVPDVSAFRALPNLKPAFFRDGLRLANAFTDTLQLAADARGGVTLLAPENVALVATLTPGTGKETVRLPVIVGDDRRTIPVGPLPAGDYILRVYSSPDAANVAFECAADYAVTVE